MAGRPDSSDGNSGETSRSDEGSASSDNESMEEAVNVTFENTQAYLIDSVVSIAKNMRGRNEEARAQALTLLNMLCDKGLPDEGVTMIGWCPRASDGVNLDVIFKLHQTQDAIVCLAVCVGRVLAVNADDATNLTFKLTTVDGAKDIKFNPLQDTFRLTLPGYMFM